MSQTRYILAVDGPLRIRCVICRDWSVEGHVPLIVNPCSPISYSNAACAKGETHMCAMDPSSPKTGRASLGKPMDVYRNPKSTLLEIIARHVIAE